MVLICIFLISIQVLTSVIHKANFLEGDDLQCENEMSKGRVIEEFILPKYIVFVYEITKE